YEAGCVSWEGAVVLEHYAVPYLRREGGRVIAEILELHGVCLGDVFLRLLLLYRERDRLGRDTDVRGLVVVHQLHFHFVGTDRQRRYRIALARYRDRCPAVDGYLEVAFALLRSARWLLEYEVLSCKRYRYVRRVAAYGEHLAVGRARYREYGRLRRWRRW